MATVESGMLVDILRAVLAPRERVLVLLRSVVRGSLRILLAVAIKHKVSEEKKEKLYR